MENPFRLSLYSLRSKTGKICYPHNPVIRECVGLYSTLDKAITAKRWSQRKTIYLHAVSISKSSFLRMFLFPLSKSISAKHRREFATLLPKYFGEEEF